MKPTSCYEGQGGENIPFCYVAQLDGGAQKLTGPTCRMEPIITGTIDNPRVIKEFCEDATALD